MVNVICMKWGTAYGPEYVNILHAMVRRNLTRPFRFVCFTDDTSGINDGIECQPLPEMPLVSGNPMHGWRKIGSFAPGLAGLEGPTLFLDLDLVIIDNIDCFFDHPGDFCIIENWTTPGRGIGNSSVYRFDPAKYAFVFETYCRDPKRIIETYDNEQIMVSKVIGDITFWPETWCRSFKRHSLPGGLLNCFVRPKIPEGTKILVFHGHPKPIEAARGIWPKKFKPIRPAPWILDYWREG
jgi:hypothetical protein